MIEQILIKTLYKAKVVHSIPGRLRIHVPYLKQIPKDWQAGDGYFQVAKRIKGINALSVCYQTSNVLILYDPKCHKESGILQLFQDMAEVAVRHRGDFKHFGAHQKGEALAQLVKLLEQHFVFESMDGVEEGGDDSETNSQ